MKFFKLHKQLVMITSITLILFIIIIVIFDIISNKSDDKELSASCDIAILYSKNLDLEYFNFACQGVETACKSLDKKYKTFNSSDYNNSYDDTLLAAINSNASFVLIPDSSYEETVYKYQSTYKNTYFLLINGIPHNKDFTDSTINYNVSSCVYDKSESSFLAGYAAVYEGYNKLTYICDNSDLQSLHYCYGFIQGADYAASELEKSGVSVDITYNSDPKKASFSVPVNTELAATSSDIIIENLYKDSSVSSIPVADCDSYDFNNENIILSASVNLAPLIEKNILDFYNDNQKNGGTISNKNALEYDISLKYRNSAFNKFNDSVYNKILTAVKKQEVSIVSDTTVPLDELELNHISIKDNKPLIEE